jgi:type IV pilus assembly protein PilM
MDIPFLEQAKQYFNKTMASSQETSVLGVDIGSSSIKIVQIRSNKGVATLDTYGEIALGTYGGTEIGQSTNLPPEKLAEALKVLMSEASITSKLCGVSVPFSSSLVKLIEVPALPDDKLKTVVPLEARKYIPVPINEVQLDYFIIPETEQKLFMGANSAEEAEATQLTKRMALVVAMHAETLRKHARTFELAGLNPGFFEIEVFSNIRSTVSRSLAPVAIIDLGAATSKLYLVELGIILASHVVPAGSQDITKSLAASSHVSLAKAEELKRQAGILSGVQNDDAARVSHAATLTMEKIFVESRRALLGFQKKYNKVITKVILTGGGATLKGVPEFARQQLELEIEMANPFSLLQAPAFMDETLRHVGPEFSTAVGLALRQLNEHSS